MHFSTDDPEGNENIFETSFWSIWYWTKTTLTQRSLRWSWAPISYWINECKQNKEVQCLLFWDWFSTSIRGLESSSAVNVIRLMADELNMNLTVSGWFPIYEGFAVFADELREEIAGFDCEVRCGTIKDFSSGRRSWLASGRNMVARGPSVHLFRSKCPSKTLWEKADNHGVLVEVLTRKFSTIAEVCRFGWSLCLERKHGCLWKGETSV
jgi:hypothetical protein